ncbi:MAG: hypothetical protein JWM33_3718, partial [Caulobacteraceae bacterium]|nr:hypothetical protein [Caulobacteraceae bacterium]
MRTQREDGTIKVLRLHAPIRLGSVKGFALIATPILAVSL